MKNITGLFVWFFFAGLSALTAQVEYDLDAFDGIAVTGNINVLLERGDADRAYLSAEGIPASEVTVKVTRGVLRLKLINSIFYKNESVNVRVTYRGLRSIRAHAGARLEADQAVEADQLEVRATSGAQVELSVGVNALEGAATEGGRVRLTGGAQTQDASAATGGQWEAFELDCARAYVRANTGGRVEVKAGERLEAVANTGGTVAYKGDPTETIIKTVVAGNVHQVER